jgi:hypothetical protein
MFESLADRMREDEHQEIKPGERAIRLLVVVALSVLLFAGLWFGIRMLEG